MPRPMKHRALGGCPRETYFKPRGVPLDRLEEVVLTASEWEAVRLADWEGYYQEEAASMMGVSRQTFGNTLVSAHRKLAECVLFGKALRIEDFRGGEGDPHECGRRGDGCSRGCGKRRSWKRKECREDNHDHSSTGGEV